MGSLQKCFWGVLLPEGLCLGTGAEGTHLQGVATWGLTMLLERDKHSGSLLLQVT